MARGAQALWDAGGIDPAYRAGCGGYRWPAGPPLDPPDDWGVGECECDCGCTVLTDNLYCHDCDDGWCRRDSNDDDDRVPVR